jgi:hypothetical protein
MSAPGKRAGSPCGRLRGVERCVKAYGGPGAAVTADQRRLSLISSRTMAIPKKDGSVSARAASRRGTAPFSCGAAGGEALNALGHFEVAYRPTAYTREFGKFLPGKIEEPLRVIDTVAGQAGIAQGAISCCERECRTGMREIFPFAGIAVFQIDEEMEWNARTRLDHVGKALQSLALGHWRGSEGKFDGGEGLVHGLLIRQMNAMDKQG